MENEIVENTVGTIEIQYSRPKFVRRVLENLIDLIIFSLVGLSLFMLTRYIISNTEDYQKTMSSLNDMQLNSGLYVRNDLNQIVGVVTHVDADSNNSNASKARLSEEAIDQFIIYIKDYLTEDCYQKMVTDFDNARLNKKEGEVNLFVTEEGTGKIIKNAEYYDGHSWLYKDFYFDYIDNTFTGYLVSSGEFVRLTKRINTYLMWVEIPIAFVTSVILVYFVPTIFFRRGRMTLGKALYRIGTVDSRYLSPTFWRNLAKWSIFLLEMIAGVATFGVLFILSFSLMVFSKKQQGFPDYMLGLQEVDASKNKIYFDMVEIQLENATPYKKAPDFRLIDNP